MEARVSQPATGVRMPRISLTSGAQGPLIGLMFLCIVFSLSSDYFLSVRNALNILDQVTVLGILAIGMTAVIIIGGIDLSVGSVLALSTMMIGWLSHDVGMPLVPPIVVGVLRRRLRAGIRPAGDRGEAAGLHRDAYNDVDRARCLPTS